MTTATSVTPLLRRRRPMTDEAAAAATDSALRRLRLPTMRAVLGDAITAAGRDRDTHVVILRAEGRGERVVVVTNDFHAFRTAIITRELGLVAQVRNVHEPREAARRVHLGSARHAGVAPSDANPALQVVLSEHLADGRVLELARFDLMEDLRTEAPAVVAALEQAGASVQLLSGDRMGAVQRVASQSGIAQATGECTPQGKLDALQALQAAGRHVAMVGDGLNDGPVLAGAHVSFAFGRAVPLAQSQADFVVLGDSLALVPQTVLLARRTLRVVRQNLWWAAGYNALCVPLAVVGWMPAWLAGLGMALSSLLVVLNAARLARDLPALPSSELANQRLEGTIPIDIAKPRLEAA